MKRIDRDGKSLLKHSPAPGWAYVSVSADPLGDGAWVVERSHPQVVPSIDQLLLVTTEGDVVKRFQRPGWMPFGVACDTKGHTVWVSDLRKTLTRISLDDDRVQELPIRAVAVAFGPTGDQLWVTTETELLRLDNQGKILSKVPLGRPSGQSWLAAF